LDKAKLRLSQIKWALEETFGEHNFHDTCWFLCLCPLSYRFSIHPYNALWRYVSPRASI